MTLLPETRLTSPDARELVAVMEAFEQLDLGVDEQSCPGP